MFSPTDKPIVYVKSKGAKDSLVVVELPLHPMTPEEWIEGIWLEDPVSGQLLSAKTYKFYDKLQFSARVPAAIKSVVGLAHCTVHGTWTAEPLKL